MRESRRGNVGEGPPAHPPPARWKILISQIYIAKLQINLQPPTPTSGNDKINNIFFKDLCNKDKFIGQMSTECDSVIELFCKLLLSCL